MWMRTRELVELAWPMEVTFHRAFDMTRDVEGSLEDVIAAGADRVLTSGGEQTAMLGCKRIRDLVEAAEGRIGLMAGGGVRVENVQQIAQATGALEFHTALRNTISPPVRDELKKVCLGDRGVDDYARSVVSSADVRMLRQAMDAAFSRDQNPI